MTDRLIVDLLDDLTAEREHLICLLQGLAPRHWAEASSAPGWSIRDQVSHLAFFDALAALSISDPEGFAAERARAADEGASYDRSHLRRLDGDSATLLSSWASAADRLRAAALAHPEGRRVPWFGPDMTLASTISARIMEHWAHGVDIASALGAPWEPTDRLRHVAHLAVRARSYGYVVRGMAPSKVPVRVELVAPSGTRWTYGPDDAEARITGTAEDFCLVLVRRRHVDDVDLVVSGAAAAEWLHLGQAYAGPPGAGPVRTRTRTS